MVSNGQGRRRKGCGLDLSLGPFRLRFPVAVWQAGIGEAVIGALLVLAAATGRRAVSWTAFVLSVLGIVFGLSSQRVQGPAREIHVVLVPLALIVLVLLAWTRLKVAGDP